MDPSHSSEDDRASLPLGQRLFDNMYLLLFLGVVVMLVIFTAWGLWEIVSMPKGTLP